MKTYKNSLTIDITHRKGFLKSLDFFNVNQTEVKIVRNVHSKMALLPKSLVIILQEPVLMVKSTSEIYDHVVIACYFLFATILSHQG